MFARLQKMLGFRNGKGHSASSYPLVTFDGIGRSPVMLDGRRVRIMRALPERKDIGGFYTGRLISSASFFGQNARLDVSEEMPLTNPYRQSAAVYACTRARSIPLSQVQVRLYSTREGSDERKAVPDHPFAEVLDAPNPLCSQQLLKEYMEASLCLNGQFFLFLERETPFEWPRAIWPLPPTRQFMEYVPDPMSGLPTSWTYKPGGGKDNVPLQLWQVVHGKYWNPEDPVYGLAPWEAASMPAFQDWDIRRFNRAFLKNSCDPGGHFESLDGQELTEKQKREFMDQFRDRHSGPARAFKPMILGSMKWIPNQIPHREMHFPEQAQFNLRDIMMVYGVKKTNLGLDDDVNRATAEVQDRSIWDMALIPDIRLIEYAMWLWCRFVEDGRYEVCFDLGQVPALRKDVTSKVSAAQGLWSCGVPMERVNRLLDLGLEEFDGWDVGYVSAGVVPSGMAGIAGAPAEKKSAAAVAARLPEAESKALGERWHSRVRAPIEKDAAAKVSRFWFEYCAEVKRRFAEATGWRKGMVAPEAKAPAAFDPRSMLPPAKEWDAKLQRWMEPIYRRAILNGAAAKAADIGSEMVLEWTDETAEWMRRKCFKRLAQSTAHGREAIARYVSKGVEAGESLDEIATRISRARKALQNNAMTVARTEVGRAVEHGAYEEAVESDVVEGHWWGIINDGNARESHQKMSGQYRPLGEPFLTGDGNRLLYPNDENGIGSEVIACRCYLRAKLKKE